MFQGRWWFGFEEPVSIQDVIRGTAVWFLSNNGPLPAKRLLVGLLGKKTISSLPGTPNTVRKIGILSEYIARRHPSTCNWPTADTLNVCRTICSTMEEDISFHHRGGMEPSCIKSSPGGISRTPCHTGPRNISALADRPVVLPKTSVLWTLQMPFLACCVGAQKNWDPVG